ncbi:methylenetetrahydrofolate reductase [Halovulum sp. GXIMD14794]
MATILPFGRKAARAAQPASASGELADFVQGYSIEVMPRTAAKVEDFRAILPEGTRVYVAHIAGTPIEDMIATAARLVDEGFTVMPHLPARIIPDRATLDDWAARYADVGVSQALMIAGGVSEPVGDFHSSMQVMESGVLDKRGFARLHVAGHPEGNRDIDPKGGEQVVMEALRWKSDFAERTDADMAIATQFCFEAEPVIAWADRLREAGVDLPIHIGVAGPAKLQTLIKFAMTCGVGPSIRVLQRRAADITKLMLPFTPDQILQDLAAHKAAHPEFQVEAVHVFPLGGIPGAAEFMNAAGRPAGSTAAARA